MFNLHLAKFYINLLFYLQQLSICTIHVSAFFWKLRSLFIAVIRQIIYLRAEYLSLKKIYEYYIVFIQYRYFSLILHDIKIGVKLFYKNNMYDYVLRLRIFCETTGKEDCDLQRVFPIKNGCISLDRLVSTKKVFAEALLIDHDSLFSALFQINTFYNYKIQ